MIDAQPFCASANLAGFYAKIFFASAVNGAFPVLANDIRFAHPALTHIVAVPLLFPFSIALFISARFTFFAWIRPRFLMLEFRKRLFYAAADTDLFHGYARHGN